MPSISPTPKPLSGARILITRAQSQAGELKTMLEAEGAQVMDVPTIEIRPPQSYAALDRAINKLAQYAWLILSSVNGVRAFFERAEAAKCGNDVLRHPHIAAIGPATRKAIEERGLGVDIVPDKYVAEAVVEALRERVPGKRVLLVRARVARDVLPEQLRAAGARVDVVEAYETVIPQASRTALREALARQPDVVTFTSSSTARNCLELLDGNTDSLRSVKIASIGPVTSRTLRELGLTVHIEAGEHTMAGLVRAITNHLAGGT